MTLTRARRRRRPLPETGAVVDLLEHRQVAVRDAACRAMGVTGDAEVRALREVVGSSRAVWYPAGVLAGFFAIDHALTVMFNVLGPDIGRSLGISKGVLAFVLLQKSQGFMIAALQMTARVQRVPERARLSVLTAFQWAVVTILAAFVTHWLGLMVATMLAGAAAGSVYALHQPLLADAYPVEARVRVLAVHRAGGVIGAVLAPAAVAVLGGVLGLSWRGVLVVTGLAFVVVALAGRRLREPGYGQADTDAARRAVHEDAGSPPPEAPGDDVEGGFFELLRRVWLVPTVRRVLAAWAVLGGVLYPLEVFLSFHLEQRWGFTVGPRAAFVAAAWAFAIPALVWAGRRGEQAFRVDPARLLDLVRVLLLVLAGGLVVAPFMPVAWLALPAFGLVFATTAAIAPLLTTAVFAVVRPRLRPHAASLAGIFLTGVGGTAGTLLLRGIESRFGSVIAIAVLSVPAAFAARVVAGARATIGTDLRRMVDEVVEEEEIGRLRAAGAHLPMLACRHVDFAYSGHQVLFDVNLSVDEGEMVALLGTNGAGKSTLLRVISGLGMPSAGTVHFDGRNITFLDAERRLPLGITQVPGGRAVFGPLSVVENLRVFGYSHGRDQKAVERGIEATFEAFPNLASKRDQAAGTLSGGEQQMLGLGQAFIVSPRLLLIDELSLGLAPKIVGELLEMVRHINAGGTAVVLVEQSVNIALSLVQRAYFMEKGQVRFEGRAADLLERRDLLRSVFLEGAAVGLTS